MQQTALTTNKTKMKNALPQNQGLFQENILKPTEG
jgi:hypothetical protein